MDITDGQLLRELRQALDEVADQGMDAQVRAVEETLRNHGATMADVQRALGAIKDRRRREIAGLAGRIGKIAEGQADAEATAAAVDRFLRGRGEGGGT